MSLIIFVYHAIKHNFSLRNDERNHVWRGV